MSMIWPLSFRSIPRISRWQVCQDSLASIKDNSVTMLLDIAVHHVPLSSKCRTLFTSLLQNSATFNLYNNKSSKWLTRRRASDWRNRTSRNKLRISQITRMGKEQSFFAHSFCQLTTLYRWILSKNLDFRFVFRSLNRNFAQFCYYFVTETPSERT